MMIGARNFYIWFLNKPTKGVQEKGRLILWITCNCLVHNFQEITSNQTEYKHTSKYYRNSKITHDKQMHVVGSKTCDLLT